MKTSLTVRSLPAVFMLAGLISISLPSHAEEALAPANWLEAIQQGKAMTNFRLRYEHVDQEPLANNANAFTLRSLIGWQTAPLHNISLAAQLTDVHEFNHDFNDRRDNLSEAGRATYPNVVDPSYTDINQLYVDWTGIANTRLRLGRQQLNLDNVRFIGDIGFRQNMQVFDGVSLLNKSLPDTELFAAHFDRVRQIITALRRGNVDMLNAKYRLAPNTSLVAYGYLIDVANLSQNNGSATASPTAAQAGNGLGGSQDLTPSATTDASSKTMGVRIDGSAKVSSDWKVLYTAEYAKQDDYRGVSALIDAHYYKLGGGVGYGNWSLRFDHETLSSNGGRYAFQTPLGTNHLFQGWADVFLITPPQGIKDSFVSVAGNIEKVKLYAEYHVLKSDEQFDSLLSVLGDKYGHEFDASISYPVSSKLNAKLEYAKFTESDVYGTSLTAAVRKGDKEIVWLTALYSF